MMPYMMIDRPMKISPDMVKKNQVNAKLCIAQSRDAVDKIDSKVNISL